MGEYSAAAPMDSLHSASRLEEQYRELGTSVQSVRAALQERQREAEFAALQQGGDSEQQRLAHLKNLLNDRRAPALVAFTTTTANAPHGNLDTSAGGEGGSPATDRSTLIQAMLQERRGNSGPSPPENGSWQPQYHLSGGESPDQPRRGAQEPIEYDDSMSLASDTSSQAAFKQLPAHERLMKAGLEWQMKREQQFRKHLKEDITMHSPEINKTSRKMKREAAVEDLLMKRNEEYKANLEARKREKEVYEVSSLRSPRINKSSQAMKRGEPVYERLYESRRRSLAKNEVLKHSLREAEKEEVRGQPEINPVSRTLSRGVDSFFRWEEERRKKAEALKRELEENERKSVTMHPKINKKSKQLVQSKDDRFLPVEDRLMTWQLEQEEKKHRLRASTPTGDGRPTISAHSANLVRPGRVGDRLYNLAMNTDEKRKSLLAKHQRDLILQRDSSTGQRLFSPLINPRSAALIRDKPIEEILQESGKKSEEERRHLEGKLARKMERERRSSSMGPVSKFLVDMMEHRTHKSAEDRLQQPIHNLKSRAKDTLEDSQSQAYTFKPAVNPKSTKLYSNKVGKPSMSHQERVQRLQELEQQRIHWLEQQRKQREEEEVKECTFAPERIAETSYQSNVVRSSSTPRRRNHDDFVRRNAQWQKSIEQRLEEERKKYAQKEVEDCTFHPQLEDISRSSSRSSSPAPPSASSPRFMKDTTQAQRRRNPAVTRKQALEAAAAAQSQLASSHNLRTYTPPPQRPESRPVREAFVTSSAMEYHVPQHSSTAAGNVSQNSSIYVTSEELEKLRELEREYIRLQQQQQFEESAEKHNRGRAAVGSAPSDDDEYDVSTDEEDDLVQASFPQDSHHKAAPSLGEGDEEFSLSKVLPYLTPEEKKALQMQQNVDQIDWRQRGAKTSAPVTSSSGGVRPTDEDAPVQVQHGSKNEQEGVQGQDRKEEEKEEEEEDWVQNKEQLSFSGVEGISADELAETQALLRQLMQEGHALETPPPAPSAHTQEWREEEEEEEEEDMEDLPPQRFAPRARTAVSTTSSQ